MPTPQENYVRERWVQQRYTDSSGKIDYGAYFDDLKGRNRGTPNPVTPPTSYTNAEWLVRERVIESHYNQSRQNGNTGTYNDFRTQWLKDQANANPLNRQQPTTGNSGNSGTALQRSQSPAPVIEIERPRGSNPPKSLPTNSPVIGGAAVAAAGAVVDSLYKSKPVQRMLQDASLGLSDILRPLTGKPPLTPAQKQWFRDNPGKPATPDNGYPPDAPKPNQPNQPGNNNPNGYNPSSPATPGNNNQRPGLPGNLPINPTNPNRPNTNIPGGFNPNSPGSAPGLGQPGGTKSYNFPDTSSVVGFTITSRIQVQFWQVVSGGFEYREGAPTWTEVSKSYTGIPKRVEARTVNYRKQGKFEFYEIEIWLIYKPNPFDPEVEDKVTGFSHGLNFRFVDNEVIYKRVNAPNQSLPMQPNASGQPGQPDFNAPPMIPTISPNIGNPQVNQISPIVAPPVMPIQATPPRVPFRSPNLNPANSPGGSPTGTPSPNPSPSPSPTGSPNPGQPRGSNNPSPNGVQSGNQSSGSPNTGTSTGTNTGTSNQTGTQNNPFTGMPIVPIPVMPSPGTATGNQGFTATPSKDPLVKNPVDNQGRLRGGVNDELNDKKAPTPVPNQVTPPVCQHDPCMAELQRNSRNNDEMIEVQVNRFLIWDRLMGARMVPEKVRVPANMANFATVSLNRQADIRSRFGRHEMIQRFQTFINTMATVATLHNAAMLSTSAAQSLGNLITEGFQTFAPFFGVPDETAQAFDFNEVAGKQFNEFMESLLGETVWNGTKESWLKLNRIVSTASNIIWSIRSIVDSTNMLLEFAVENTGKIGNALKKWRVVGENAYPWMPENANAQNRWSKFVQRFTDGVEGIDNTASSLSSAVGEVRNIRDELNELKNNREEFDKAVKDIQPKTRDNNTAVKTTVDTERASSKAPSEIKREDREQGSEE